MLRTAVEIGTNIKRINQLLGCGIFDPARVTDVLRRAAFTEVMIALRDLMRKAEVHDERIAFTDDVLLTPAVRDITDLVTYVRDALCHVDSAKNTLSLGEDDADDVFFVYRLFRAEALQLRSTDALIGCEFSDDIAYCFGPQRIYWKRHVLRAFAEAQLRLNRALDRDPSPIWRN
jgi:hypothetical protein